jgi:antitoxin VapB
MPLTIRDERVNQLAEQARQILNAPTKTDAIRQALEKVVETAPPSQQPETRRLAERLERIRDKYNMPAYEKLEPFDEKAFLDEMWGDLDVHR